jgi:hypothetical protein
LYGAQSPRKQTFSDKPASTGSKKLALKHKLNQHHTTNRLARLLSCRPKLPFQRSVNTTPNFAITPKVRRVQSRSFSSANPNAALHPKAVALDTFG